MFKFNTLLINNCFVVQSKNKKQKKIIFKTKFIFITINVTSINKYNAYFFSKFFFLNQLNFCYYFLFRYVSFIGKSYKVITKKKYINFKFNRSHPTVLIFNKNICFSKIKKNIFKFKFFYIKDFIWLKNYLQKIRLLNVFTQRGIKISKTIKFKKKGKVSTYVM